MGNAEIKVTRLLASTLVLAGAAWATAGAQPAGHEGMRQVSARLETGRNRHDARVLASLTAGRAEARAIAILAGFLRMSAVQACFVKPGVNAFQHAHGQSADASIEATLLARMAEAPLVVAKPNRLWLIASAHNASLLANPPPR